MSDNSPPPPPPPPANLNPPPGYSGYQSTPWTSVPLKRVGGLAKALTILLGVVVLGALVDLALLGQRVDLAEDLIAGRIDDDQFTTDLGAASLGSVLFGLATLAVIVLSIIWLYRVVSNHRALGRQTSWSPGFAIGGWFLPPGLYVIPLLILRENWKAAEPTIPPGSDGWRQVKESPLPWVWFVLYSLVPLALAIAGASFFFSNFGGDADDLADSIVDSRGLTVAQSVAVVLGAVAWALVVRGMTTRHTQLSGEATAR